MMLISVSFFACNTGNTDCDLLWVLENPDDHRVEFKNGVLHIEAKSPEEGRAVTIRQVELEGNFIAFLQFDNFERDLNGSYLRFFVRIPGQNSVASAIITDLSPMGPGLQIGAVVDLTDSLGFGDSTDYAIADAGKGEFSIYREGTFVTVTAADDLGNFSKKTIAFGTEALEIGIEVGSQVDHSSSNARTSVELKNFTISTLAVGGVPTFVQSDDFECMSILP